MNANPGRRSSDRDDIFDVAGFGTIVVDQISLVPHYPAPDEKLAADEMLIQPGGPVPAALSVLSRFGRKTVLAGCIGDDLWGEWLLKSLAARMIATDFLVSVPGTRTPFAQICADRTRGTRAVIHDEGSLPALTLPLLGLRCDGATPSQRASDILRQLPQARCLHIDGREHDTIPLIIDEYRKRGTKISIDCGTFRRRTIELLPLVDCIIMPASFARSVFGQRPLDRLVADSHDAWLQASHIVITNGEQGSVGWCNGEIIQQGAWPVSALDSCGAGDIHAGAILHAFLEDWPLSRALPFAAAAAALKCTTLGNGTLPKDLDDVFLFLDEQTQAR